MAYARKWVRLDDRLFLNRLDARKHGYGGRLGLELHLWIKNLRGIRSSLIIREKLEMAGLA